MTFYSANILREKEFGLVRVAKTVSLLGCHYVLGQFQIKFKFDPFAKVYKIFISFRIYQNRKFQKIDIFIGSC